MWDLLKISAILFQVSLETMSVLMPVSGDSLYKTVTQKKS